MEVNCESGIPSSKSRETTAEKLWDVSVNNADDKTIEEFILLEKEILVSGVGLDVLLESLILDESIVGANKYTR